MIEKIVLQNFKCYQQEAFNFSSLTVFCGSNSSGKSTVIQSILLYYQNLVNAAIDDEKIELMGEYFNFGTLADIQCDTATDQYIKLQINDSVLSIDGEANAPDAYIVDLDNKTTITYNLFNHSFLYLSADRYGPKNSSNIKFNSSEFNVGIYGEYAFSEYDRVKLQPVGNVLLAQAITGLTADTITAKVVVENAMQKICPGFSIETTRVKSMDTVTTNFATNSGKSIRPTNVGFGFSCIFPIVLAAICIEPGGTLIIENPEIHLHPAAQSELAAFLTLVSAHGVQVIIETHSDHIVNGIRVFAKENPLDDGAVIINSVRNEDSQRIVKEIIIDKDGNFSDIDDGFFDQIEKDLIRLF